MKTPEINKECLKPTAFIAGIFGRNAVVHENTLKDALSNIQHLETANAELLTEVKQLETKCHQLEQERDAACLKNRSIETVRPWREGGQP